ncbi:MAG: flagellar basal body P-ring protein FlgI [Proteobacteria bacterium]|nr:flagellar basal body P-ring protein FlgI [Pseudomonadota bacterium]
MKRSALFSLLALVALPSLANASRIKDVARWDGVEDNVVVGVGVVVGLQGTGDGGQAVRDFLRGAAGALESDIDPSKLRSKNSALVTVTATLPAFARKGNHIDVTVSSIGDAKSLSGGTLLPTMLRDTAGRAVWAVAEGSLTIGGYSAAAGGAGAQKNHTTVGRVPNGAKVVQELAVDMLHRDVLELSLREADFHTAVSAARAVNRELLGDFAAAVDSGTVTIGVPPQYQGRVPELVARLEMLDIDTDVTARVVVNERTGTVVMGADVRIATVAVAHGGLTLEVDTRLGVSQPGPFSGGETVVVPETSLEVEEENRRLEVVQGVSIGEVVGALNQLGVAPRDLISILQAIRQAGALDAELEVL